MKKGLRIQKLENKGHGFETLTTKVGTKFESQNRLSSNSGFFGKPLEI